MASVGLKAKAGMPPMPPIICAAGTAGTACEHAMRPQQVSLQAGGEGRMQSEAHSALAMPHAGLAVRHVGVHIPAAAITPTCCRPAMPPMPASMDAITSWAPASNDDGA